MELTYDVSNGCPRVDFNFSSTPSRLHRRRATDGRWALFNTSGVVGAHLDRSNGSYRSSLESLFNLSTQFIRTHHIYDVGHGLGGLL